MDITLNFPKTLSGIAGYPYGEQVYNEQVKELIDWNEDITIIFPNHITLVAISFVQGFFNDMVAHWGFDETMKHVTIQAATPELIKNIQKNLLNIL
ncbi:MAG: DUF4325 domain-containing protein [Oscillospiraceae bacterium]|nr:DUF4325 domain-containing protein [Oscillospiraceae bacterium]